MIIENYGWNSELQAYWLATAQPGWQPARITAAFGAAYRIVTNHGESDATPAGRLRIDGSPTPAVGDWVASSGPRIEAILPRRSALARKNPGRTAEPQTLAANVDVCFLVSGLDADFNPRRIERYLAMVAAANATPVIVLNKADLDPDWNAVYSELPPAVASVAISARLGTGVEHLHQFVRPAQTAALLGSSGAGKSTLINSLIGHERQRTAEVRAHDQRGRHTTTHRELILLEEGWLLVDMPGLRELEPWAPDLGRAFEDLQDYSGRCRFSDCTHANEPGCAVRAALEAGQLDPARLENFRKLEREAAFQRRKTDQNAAREEKERWKKIHRRIKQINKHRA